MTDREPLPPVKPWLWPIEWAADEKFWRDVASRTTAGLLIILVTYVFAVAWGFLQLPVPSFAIVVVSALALALTTAGTIVVIVRKIRRRQSWRRSGIGYALLGNFVVLIVVFLPTLRGA